MAKFETKLGHRFEIPNHDGKYARMLIQQIYEDENQQHRNQYMHETFKNCTMRTVEKRETVFDDKLRTLLYVKNTYLVAENTDYKEVETVNYYTKGCVNTSLFHKVEVILQIEGFRKRLFVEWKGNPTFHDLIDNIMDDLWEEFKEKPEKHVGVRRFEGGGFELMMSDIDGDYGYIEIENLRELKNSLISLRVVEFKENITD